MVGGPSIVFCRYAEAGKSKIRSHVYKDPKMCKPVVGYDANSLYLYCSRDALWEREICRS